MNSIPHQAPHHRIRLHATILGLALTVAGLSLSAEPRSGDAPPDDTTITAAVERAMRFDSTVPSNTITVGVDRGVVTLEGRVSDLLEKERAAKVVQQVRGVRSIVNTIQVDPEPRPDAEIAADVKAALRYDPATEIRDIQPTVDGGVVTLSGTVQSWQERKLAAHTAKGVRGVREVVDSLTVKAPASRADREIQADVEGALRSNPWVDADLVTVQVSNGNVRLSGSVSSLAQRNIAEGLAWVTGTRAVETDALAVNSWAEAPAARPGPPAPSDERIRSSVEAAIRLDPRISSDQLRVEVSGGMVTLSGVVHTLRAQNAAESDARNTVGVQRVFNFLKVRSTEREEDLDLSRTIEAALERNSITGDAEIDVKVRDGEVWLTGSADTFFEKSEAERIVQGAEGVSAIHNQLQVHMPDRTFYDYGYDPLWDLEPIYRGEIGAAGTAGRPYATDDQLKEDIRDELFWSPFVDGDDVSVTVRNGVATLSGTVRDWSEFRAATDNAIEAGATSVINQLKVGRPSGS